MAGGSRIVSAAELWGPILSASLQHVTQAELFDKYINPAVERLGGKLSFSTVTDIARLRGNANRVALASEALTRSPETNAVTSDVIGAPFYARPFAAQEAASAYEVLFEAHIVTPRGPETTYYRLTYGSNLPGSVGEIRADVDAFAEDFANSYGAELSGVGRILLNVI